MPARKKSNMLFMCNHYICHSSNPLNFKIMKTQKIFTTILIICLFTGISGLFASCNMLGVRGNGDVQKETRKVSSFDGIEVSGAFKVYIKQGATEEVVVESDANLLPLIRTEVVGSTLRIDTRKPVNNVTTMKVYITMKELKRIDVSGAVDILSEGRISVPELSYDASGASEVDMEIAVQRLKVDCSGAGKIKLRGTAANVGMDLSGASDVFAYDLAAETYDIDISGAGNAQINVSKSLRAEISGAGSIRYKGSPSEIDQQVSGAGSIKKSN